MEVVGVREVHGGVAGPPRCRGSSRRCGGVKHCGTHQRLSRGHRGGREEGREAGRAAKEDNGAVE